MLAMFLAKASPAVQRLHHSNLALVSPRFSCTDPCPANLGVHSAEPAVILLEQPCHIQHEYDRNSDHNDDDDDGGFGKYLKKTKSSHGFIPHLKSNKLVVMLDSPKLAMSTPEVISLHQPELNVCYLLMKLNNAKLVERPVYVFSNLDPYTVCSFS